MPFFTEFSVVSTATDDCVPSMAAVAAVTIVVYAERINCIGKREYNQNITMRK